MQDGQELLDGGPDFEKRRCEMKKKDRAEQSRPG